MTIDQLYLDHYYKIVIFMAAHHSIAGIMIFSTNLLWSCAFGFLDLRVSVLELKVFILDN